MTLLCLNTLKKKEITPPKKKNKQTNKQNKTNKQTKIKKTKQNTYVDINGPSRYRCIEEEYEFQKLSY